MIAFHVGANMEFEVAGKLNRDAICSNFLLIIPQQYIYKLYGHFAREKIVVVKH